MSLPAATMTDSALGVCLHVYMSTTPSPPGGPVPTPVPLTLPFVGTLVGPCCPTVFICGKPAAVVPDTITNTAVHPTVGGGAIPGPAVPAATNTGTAMVGSTTVMAGGKPALYLGSKGTPDCGTVTSGGTTVIGTAVTVLIGN